MDRQPSTRQADEFGAFERLTRKLLAVLKKEVARKIAARRARKKTRSRSFHS